MTTATALAHPNLAFIKYSEGKLGPTDGKDPYKAGYVIDGIILWDEALTIINQPALVYMFAQPTMDKSTVKSRLP